MEGNTYVKNAIRTESHRELDADLIELFALLDVARRTAAIVDKFKKGIFYGKEIKRDFLAIELNKLHDIIGTLSTLSTLHKFPNVAKGLKDTLARETSCERDDLCYPNRRLTHAAIGIFTEAGEMIEALQREMKTGDLDAVNFSEENGDVDWYQALIYDETNTTEAATREKNIAKLRARFPQKFTEEAAVNRNLSAERKILEG
jgi:hypothetical protein